MNEVKAIVEAFAAANGRGERCALATVVSVEGSSYRRTGERMLVTETPRAPRAGRAGRRRAARSPRPAREPAGTPAPPRARRLVRVAIALLSCDRDRQILERTYLFEEPKRDVCAALRLSGRSLRPRDLPRPRPHAADAEELTGIHLAR